MSITARNFGLMLIKPICLIALGPGLLVILRCLQDLPVTELHEQPQITLDYSGQNHGHSDAPGATS